VPTVQSAEPVSYSPAHLLADNAVPILHDVLPVDQGFEFASLHVPFHRYMADDDRTLFRCSILRDIAKHPEEISRRWFVAQWDPDFHEVAERRFDALVGTAASPYGDRPDGFAEAWGPDSKSREVNERTRGAPCQAGRRQPSSIGSRLFRIRADRRSNRFREKRPCKTSRNGGAP